MGDVLKNIKLLLKYPLILIFLGFIFLYSIFDSLVPERTFSDLENRSLTTFPKFSIDELLNNEYTPKYEEYVNDQFAFRDSWIDIKSRMEWLLTKVENNGVIYGNNDQLYTKLFSIDDEQLQKNLNAMEGFTEREGDNVTVMIVPVASNILSDGMPASPPMIDENELIDTIYSSASSANIVDVRDTLSEHSDEYIYYRTDHHWTSYGAYLAYIEYAEQKGLNVFNIENYEAINTEGFLGTNFSKCKYFAAVPDTLTYYNIDNTMVLGDRELPLYDTSKLTSVDKYATFLHGNYGFLTVNGDGEGSVLVVKDSYANSFVPFLTASYEKIDVIDFRLYNNSVSQLMEENKYDDVLILYNSSTFAEDGNFAKILFN